MSHCVVNRTHIHTQIHEQSNELCTNTHHLTGSNLIYNQFCIKKCWLILSQGETNITGFNYHTYVFVLHTTRVLFLNKHMFE